MDITQKIFGAELRWQRKCLWRIKYLLVTWISNKRRE